LAGAAGSNEHEAAQKGRSQVVGVATGHRRFGFERAGQQGGGIEAGVEEMVGGDRAGDGRRGAAALSTRERQSLRDAHRGAAAISGARKDGVGGDRSCVACGIGWQVGMAGVVDDNAAFVTQCEGGFIAAAGNRKSENVEPRPDVADGSWRVRG